MAAAPGRGRQRTPQGSLGGSHWNAQRIFLEFFVRGRKLSQIISTLEALAVLLSLKLSATHQPERQRSRVTILPT